MEQAPPRKSRVLVVEDHPLLREGIVLLLNRQTDLVCCGVAATIAEALAAARMLAPDVILLDILLKDGNSLQLLTPLRSEFPSLRILMLSHFDEMLYAEQALRAGASGYISKEEPSLEVLRAIQTVLRGEVYVSSQVAARLLHLFVGAKVYTSATGVQRLSDRELQVLRLVGAGKSTREIAAMMSLSVKTVETYREHLKHKLDLSSGAELVNYATHWVETAKVVIPIQNLSGDNYGGGASPKGAGDSLKGGT